MTSERPIRQLVQVCFDQAADRLEATGNQEEANNLRMATVHWLRHTGISEDVKHRPREHASLACLVKYSHHAFVCYNIRKFIGLGSLIEEFFQAF